MKGYSFMRYVRVFLTPILGTWNSLVTTGQIRSLLLAKPVNRKGEALPWFSYADINYLDQLRLEGHFLVLPTEPSAPGRSRSRMGSRNDRFPQGLGTTLPHDA